MILDEKLEFCDATSIAAAAGTAQVGDVIDLRNAGRDLLDTLYLVVQVTAAFVGSGASVNLQLTTSSAENLGTSPVVLWESGVLGVASWSLGKTFIVPLQGGNIELLERYLGLRAVTSGATTTTAAINAFLTADPQNWRAYADAQN